MPSTNTPNVDLEHLFIIAGIKRLGGWADGQFFSAEKTRDDYVFGEGGDGESYTIRVPSNSWVGTCTLLQTSRSNDYLNELRQLQLNTPGNLPFNFSVSHEGTVLGSASARIIAPPAVSYGSGGIETRVWRFHLASFVGPIRGISSDGTLDLSSLA